MQADAELHQQHQHLQPTPAMPSPTVTPAVVAVPSTPPSSHAPPQQATDGSMAGGGEADASRVGAQRWMLLQELCARLHPSGLGAPKPKMSQLDLTGEYIAEIFVGTYVVLLSPLSSPRATVCMHWPCSSTNTVTYARSRYVHMNGRILTLSCAGSQQHIRLHQNNTNYRSH